MSPQVGIISMDVSNNVNSTGTDRGFGTGWSD